MGRLKDSLKSEKSEVYKWKDLVKELRSLLDGRNLDLDRKREEVRGSVTVWGQDARGGGGRSLLGVRKREEVGSGYCWGSGCAKRWSAGHCWGSESARR